MGKKTTTDSVRYVGRYEEVELWCPGPDGGEKRREYVKHGEVLVTTPEHAASLLEQVGEWEPARAPAATDEKEG